LLAAAALLAAPRPMAAQEANPDWPCIQRFVPELTAAQMWAGPSPGAAEPSPNADDTAQLAHRLASRSMPVDEAQAAIDQFADSLAPEERNAQLASLFHEVLQVINQERKRIIAGIESYARNQRALAERIRQESANLADVQPGVAPDPETAERLNEREWDMRIFEDRRHMLSQICEQPVLLEQRAFALSRAMQTELEPK
jgi:hypothetical protein